MIEHIILQHGHSVAGSVQVSGDYVEKFLNNKNDTDIMRHPAGREMAFRMIVHILEARHETYVYKTPLTWIEMLKRDYAPEWIKKKWPVKYSAEEVVVRDLFPFPNVKLKEQFGDCIRVAIKTEPVIYGRKKP